MMIRPASTRTPSSTHSQVKLVPEEAPGAAEPPPGVAGAEVAAFRVGGWAVGGAVALGRAEIAAVRLGTLPIELVMGPPHPAARHPTTTMATAADSFPLEHRMPSTLFERSGDVITRTRVIPPGRRGVRHLPRACREALA
jgi:hypothetical protein